MNFARLLIGRGGINIWMGRTTTKNTQTVIRIYGAPLQRNFAATAYKQTKENNNVTSFTSPLDSQIQQMELGVISTPNRLAHRTTAVASNASAQILKKLPARKRGRSGNALAKDIESAGFYKVSAYATAEEYDLEALFAGLNTQDLYETKRFFSTDNLGVEQDVLYVTAKYQVDAESRDIFFFREGSVVLWNFNELETNNILSFLRQYEKDAYLRPLVRGESEVMPYTYIPPAAVDVEGDLIVETEQTRAFFQKGKFFLTLGVDNFLQKYTFTNAMATSIKLGIWEATLDRYIDSMEYLTEDMKKGRRIRISRADVLRKTGELLALRHVINLSSDLLDTPDFYWDRKELEALYLQVCSYFSISRRTKVMNEKLNHCVELAELLSHNLNDSLMVRLEWIIIILIMVEVGFEIVHYMDRFYTKEEEVAAVIALH